jgi:hypothetical protein
MYHKNSTRQSGDKVMKRNGWFLIVIYALFCNSAWAEVHIIYDPTSLTIPNGRIDGALYDSLSWLGPRCSYGSGGQYIGDSPVSDSISCDSPDDEVGPLYVASEVGISEEGIFYGKAHGESSESTNPMWGYPIHTVASANGGIWFTVDNATLSLDWIAEGFEGYDETGWKGVLFETGWSIELHKLTFTPEGTFLDLVYSTDSNQESSSEGTQLLDLDPAHTYQMTWSMGIKCSTPGDHGWAQLSLDLTNLEEFEYLIWPLEVGRTWTYHCQDSNGTEWTETREVIDSNNLGEELYYKVRIINNYPYAPTETDVYVRSTNYALYEWKNGREVMIITAGPVGVGILNEDTVREITSEELMTVPYGGPYESYTYEIRDVNDTSPYSLASFVQGLGIIKIIDYSVGYAPVIKELQSIVPDHLCGDYGYPYPVGDENHDCIVNFQDLGVVAEHWLVCTKPDY